MFAGYMSENGVRRYNYNIAANFMPIVFCLIFKFCCIFIVSNIKRQIALLSDRCLVFLCSRGKVLIRLFCAV